MVYVIGSGLTGIATAMGLVRRGFRPTILDAGLRAEPTISELKARLASTEPEFWNTADVDRLRRTGSAASSGIPQKLHFGSAFPYQNADAETSAIFHSASILRSFAQGGFSNVWGAVIQPLQRRDFRSWPFGFEDMDRHYKAVHDLISTSEMLQPSSQARAMHDDYLRHRPELEREGIRLDYAKLAVRTADDTTGKGCRHCGFCLYGCPYDSIFSAAPQLMQMVQEGTISYVPGVLVDRITTTNRNVRIETRSLNDDAPRAFEGRAAFLAAGVLESARIVLNSTNRSAVPLRVQQSDIFTIPMLRYRPAADISAEKLHTLCQMIVDIEDAAISEHPIQLQLYGYNDLYAQILDRRTGFLSSMLRPLFRSLSERLIVAFGYLHSDISAPVWITSAGSGIGRLELESQAGVHTHRVGRAVARKLFRARHYLRTSPIPMQLRFDHAGGGHRSGGCFPMRKEPAGLETDLWGRIPGFPGLHVVDASVLPNIPAGPVAFTAMANAHRIAEECPIGDAA